MITLYMNPACPFCRKTLEEAHALGVPLLVKDIHETEVADELIRLGGKKQMPYMVDEESGVSMYESEDIIKYLHQKFAPTT